MFDTRSGFWLMASIVITSVLATAAIIVFAPDDAADLRQLRRRHRGADDDHPADDRHPRRDQRVEPAQRPDDLHPGAAPRPGAGREVPRGRRASASSRCSSPSSSARSAPSSAAWSPASTRCGTPRVTEFALIVLGSVLGMLFGFMLGVRHPQLGRRDRRLLRLHARAAPAARPARDEPAVVRRPAAVGRLQQRADACCSTAASPTEQWQQLAVSGTIWFLLPLAVGLFIVRRAEVK